MPASRDAYAFSEHGQHYLFSAEERNLAGRVVSCKDAVSTTKVPEGGGVKPGLANTGNPNIVVVGGLVTGLLPGKDFSTDLPKANRGQSVAQLLGEDALMAEAGQSNGNTFRVIKKWDKTGRHYAVVDMII